MDTTNGYQQSDCPTCGQTVRTYTNGYVQSLRRWSANGIVRYYPNGDHAPACEATMANRAANVARQEAHADLGAALAALATNPALTPEERATRAAELIASHAA